jgi:hypothetical protein
MQQKTIVKRLQFGLAGTLCLACALIGGCPPEDFDAALAFTQDDVDDIVSDGSLTPQEQRDRLLALGADPVTINGLMADSEFGNQFGGTIRSAYLKVSGDQFQQLTPDEVQLYALGASDVSDDLDVSPTDTEAQAIADFFSSAGIDSSAELGAFLDDNSSVVPDTIPDGVLGPLFVDFDAELLLPRLP